VLQHRSPPPPLTLVRPSLNTKRVPGVMYSGRCRNLKRTHALQQQQQQKLTRRCDTEGPAAAMPN
jgi:hypothetical protein